MPTETLIIVFASLFVLLVLQAIFLVIVWRRLRVFFKGKEAASLEEHIVSLTSQVKKLESEKEKLQEIVSVLETKSKQSLRGIGTVRFNPFADAGSNQSFAVAFLNENGDGVVLSSLYARERSAVYAKPVSQLNSSFGLSEEEKKAIEKAKL